MVYSDGTFGQQLMRLIEENQYCNVVGWIDVDYREYRRCCLDVDSIESIDFMNYDYVLVATVDGAMADAIRSKLVWRGVDFDRILTVDCLEDKRRHLLEKYLNV